MNVLHYSKTSVTTDLIMSDRKGDHPVRLPNVYTQEDIPVSHEQTPKPKEMATSETTPRKDTRLLT